MLPGSAQPARHWTTPLWLHNTGGPVAPDAPETGPGELSPLVLTRIKCPQGELNFMSTFTTFGMPLDITVTSLRIEHLIPADAPTWQIMTAAYEQSRL